MKKYLILLIFAILNAITANLMPDSSSCPSVEVLPNFNVSELDLNQMLDNQNLDFRAYVKSPKDYYEKLKKKKGFFPKLCDTLHLYFPIISDRTQKLIFYNLTPRYCRRCDLSKIPKNKLVLFMWEPPVVLKRMYKPKTLHCFGRIYTWNDDLVDNQTFFKFYYPVLQSMISSRPSFQNKKLCTLVGSDLKSSHPLELYSERKKTIEYFEKVNEIGFEFYGRGWREGIQSSYRGSIENKIETIKNYRFCICYENMRDIKGYITEKIFDCFAAGIIPIYWGASNITDDIPANCFINRCDFDSLEALHTFLKQMEQKEYDDYITRIAHYLDSESAQRYSHAYFEKLFAEAVCN